MIQNGRIFIANFEHPTIMAIFCKKKIHKPQSRQRTGQPLPLCKDCPVVM